MIGLSELTIITLYQPHLVIPIRKLLVLFIYLTQQRDFHFVYTGVNTNLSKEFKQFPFTLEQYLHKSLQAKKNSSAFPDFNLIEASATNNTLGGFPAYEIVWTYNHPTYGMRKIVEFGTVGKMETKDTL